MTDEIAAKTVMLAIKTGKITANILYKMLKSFADQTRKNMDAPKHGKQTVKQLIGQGQGASSVEVSGESMHTFKRIANKYGVDFAIVKDKDSDPPRYTVFFKAKDMDAISAVVKEYSAKVVKQQSDPKPSLIQELHKYKDEIAKMPKKVKEKIKEFVR
jgi:gas vesicle protein